MSKLLALDDLSFRLPVGVSLLHVQGDGEAKAQFSSSHPPKVVLSDPGENGGGDFSSPTASSSLPADGDTGSKETSSSPETDEEEPHSLRPISRWEKCRHTFVFVLYRLS